MLRALCASSEGWGNNLAFLPLGSESLDNPQLDALPAAHTVLLLFLSPETTDLTRLADRLAALNQRGLKIGVFRQPKHPAFSTVLIFAEFAAIDVAQSQGGNIRDYSVALRSDEVRHPVVLLATNIESIDDHQICHQWNFRLFHGPFASRENRPPQPKSDPHKLHLLHLFNLVQSDADTAKVADAHHFVRPGTDVWVLLALLREVLALGASPAAYVDGIAEVRRAVEPFTPEVAQAFSGMPAAAIRGLAADLHGAGAAAVHGRMGVSTQAHGVVCQWAIQCLNIVTGNLDRPGGTMFTSPAVDLVGHKLLGAGHLGAWRSRVRGLPEFGGELPVSVLAEEILTPGEGQIRALMTIAGNPVSSTPGGGRVDEALASLEFMVAIDIYVNESTRHADVILPPTGPLERDHYDLIFHTLAVRNTAKYSPPMLPRARDARHDERRVHERHRDRLHPCASVGHDGTDPKTPKRPVAERIWSSLSHNQTLVGSSTLRHERPGSGRPAVAAMRRWSSAGLRGRQYGAPKGLFTLGRGVLAGQAVLTAIHTWPWCLGWSSGVDAPGGRF